MEIFCDDYPYLRRQAVQPLQVIIVGAGICGLSAAVALVQTGHSVTILESASQIVEVGAGLQIAPNATRILRRLGVLDRVMEYTTPLSRVSVRRWDCDKDLASSPFMPTIEQRYGAPMGVIHRGDLQRILLEAAQKRGCHIVTSQTVLAANFLFRPRVQVIDRRSGITKWFASDVIIAADGIRSTLRGQMARANGCPAQLVPTGDAAYRLLIPRERIKQNQDLSAMLDQDVAVRYMGPGGHIMAYPLRRNSLYNMVLIHPAEETTVVEHDDAWVNRGYRDEMMRTYGSWSPLIRAWLAHAEADVVEWPLATLKPLHSWVLGSVALAGDACHPMLPYVAQGAANAIEDAAVLATAFTCTDNVPLALGVYEAVRKARAERIAASAAATGQALHLPDGPEQCERDRNIKDGIQGKDDGDQWRASQWQDFVWGTDVMRITIENWDELARSCGTGKTSPRNRRTWE